MKVTLPKDYRQWYTLQELDQAKAVINACKEDTSKVADYAEQAARAIMDGASCEAMSATAETAKNNRISYNQFDLDTGYMDVIIHGLCRVFDSVTNNWSYLEVNAYLTDIWGLSDDNHEQFKLNAWYSLYRLAETN